MIHLNDWDTKKAELVTSESIVGSKDLTGKDFEMKRLKLL